MKIKPALKLISKITYNFFVIDKEVDQYFRRFYKCNSACIKRHPIEALSYFMKLNFYQWMQKPLDRVSIGSFTPPRTCITSDAVETFSFDFNKRLSLEEIKEKISKYDVISFDIFDTLVFRQLEKPDHIFSLVGVKSVYPHFKEWRIAAEKKARELNDLKYGSREVTLEDIYKVLFEKYSIPESVKEIEETLEVEKSCSNPFVKEVYNYALSLGKTIVFTTDMYLGKKTIKEILDKCGYCDQVKIYLSNEYKLRKGDGTLQKKLIEDFPGKSILHIGDSLNGDFNKFIENGLDAIYNPSPRNGQREKLLGDNVFSSTYRALINNEMNSGLWLRDHHFTHGFRVGGILTYGFCQFIEQFAKLKSVDKVCFCARDCFIVSEIYKKLFNAIPSEYLQISRNAIFKVTLDRNFNDYINRFILKFYDVYKNRTVQDFFQETGMGFLIPELEKYDIDKYFYLSNYKKDDLEDFIVLNKSVIQSHYKESKRYAEQYFRSVIGDAKKLLVVDIGWSGTCIRAFEEFVKENISKDIQIYGALMCTSRTRETTEKIIDGKWSSYIYSPVSNMDITRAIMPAKVPAKKQDLMHIPLEYIFTSYQPSLSEYSKDGFIYSNNAPQNQEQILKVFQGISYFCEKYYQYTNNIKGTVPPYVAFAPYMAMLEDRDYLYNTYKDYLYDVAMPLGLKNSHKVCWSDYMSSQGFYRENQLGKEDTSTSTKEKTILFISPEMVYTGAPRSLLRMVNVAKTLGYKPVVWTAISGPFEQEFLKNGIQVQTVPENALPKLDRKALSSKFGLVVCNTIVTDKYAEFFEGHCPLCWYIREATNIPDFITRNEKRRKYLSQSKSIYCVSNYAKKAIEKFTDEEVRVINNCVEDEVYLASDYKAGSGDKVKFLQMGTIEYRKGYDVLFAAYMSMPESYKARSEVYFAGGIINSSGPYVSNIFAKIKNEPGIHYLGLVKGEKLKIETISQMDVVVVASRDESCSLVALEGAMLSKPLVVTENVGAKYMVDEYNGLIVKTGDVDELRSAMMQLIDKQSDLLSMGEHSRKLYEQKANMETYTNALRKLYSQADAACNSSKLNNIFEKFRTLSNKESGCVLHENDSSLLKDEVQRDDIIVSLTSYPARIQKVKQTVDSILKQTHLPRKILLWLCEKEFPGHVLPQDLMNLEKNSNGVFEVRWVEENIKPHKKYYFAVIEFPDSIIITIDDDQIYPNNMIQTLYESYIKQRNCIHCNRANLITFKENGKPRLYNKWMFGYKSLLDIPSTQLMPTGVGGVLYPPHSIPKQAIDRATIEAVCLNQDDLWLKLWTTLNGWKVVVPRTFVLPKQIPDSQSTALWRFNVYNGENDLAFSKILEFLESKGVDVNSLLDTMRKDRSVL